MEEDELNFQVAESMAAEAEKRTVAQDMLGMPINPDRALREVQMAYVDGYLLGCQDVLRQIKEHRDWVNAQPPIELASYMGGATRMHKKVRLTIEKMIVDAKAALHRLQVANSGERIVTEDKDILDRLKETDGAG